MADIYPLRSSTGTTGVSSTTVSLTIPSSVATGDLMIAQIVWASAGNVFVPLTTGPVGWSRLAPLQTWFGTFSNQTMSSQVFGKATESGDASSTATWTFASAVNYGAALSAYQTGAGYVWNVVSTTAQTQSASHTASEITNPIIGGKVVGLWAGIYPQVGFRNDTNAAGTGITALTMNVPGGTANGDVMVACANCGVPAITGPVGWTLGPSPTTAKASWYKVANNEPASYIWTAASSANMTGFIETLFGVDNTTPLDVAANVAQGSVATVTWTSLTTANDNSWSLLFSVEDNNGPGDQIATPAGWTIRQVLNGAGAAAYHSSTKLITPAGSVAPTANDSNGTPAWSAYSFALRQASSAYTVPGAMTQRENRSLTNGSSGGVAGPGLMVLLADVAVQTVGPTGTYIATKTGQSPADVNYYFAYLATIVAKPSITTNDAQTGDFAADGAFATQPEGLWV